MAKLSDFLFSVGEDLLITINTRSCWEERHCLTDSYTQEERELLNPVLVKYDLVEFQESMFEHHGDMSGKEIKQSLLDAGLTFDHKFDKWAKQQDTER